MDDSSEEDCTIYIEELKSDDPNLKINAVVKITSIAQILGPHRTCAELLPYIIEIIEEQDNEDEFLIKLAAEILNLKKLIGGNSKSHLLIAPLEILSSMEEPLVREKAVEVLSQLAEGQNEGFFENHFFQIIQQLGSWDNFPSRISASSLLPVAYPHVSPDKQMILWDLFKQLCSDDTPMVRRVCAGVVSQLAQLNCLQQSSAQLLQIWGKLLKDQVDSVKVKAIEGSQYMLRLIEDKNELESYIQQFFSLAEGKEKSWRVRYTVPEFLPTILTIITRLNKDKSILKTTAVNIYQQLLKDTEPEVRSISVQTINSLLNELPNSSKEPFVAVFTTLSTDTSPHVRLSLAEQICKIASQYQANIIIASFIPIVVQLFKDEVADIRIKLAHNLSQLSAVLGPDNSKKHLVPLIQQFSSEKQWRFRLEVMSVMPKLLKVAGMESFQELQANYLEKGIMNHYQAIRDQAIENFIQFKDIFGYDSIKVFLKQCLQSLLSSPNYIYRVTYMHALIKLKDIISKEDLQAYFKDNYNSLLNDAVPNVRLNVFRCYQQLQPKLDQKLQNEFKQKAKALEHDVDIDVQYFAANYSHLKF